MALTKLLLLNKADKDVIQKDYLDTDIQQNDVGMILLELFIP